MVIFTWPDVADLQCQTSTKADACTEESDGLCFSLWRVSVCKTQTWSEQFVCTEEADGQSHDGRFIQVWADAMRQRQLMCQLVEHLRLLTPPAARRISRLLFSPLWRISVNTGQRSKINTTQSTAGWCQDVCQTSTLYLKQDDYPSGLDCTVAQSQNVWWSFSVCTWADRYYFLFIHSKWVCGHALQGKQWSHYHSVQSQTTIWNWTVTCGRGRITTAWPNMAHLSWPCLMTLNLQTSVC